MGWRVLYIEECEYLNLYLDNLKVNNRTGELLIPITDIHTLIIDNYRTVLSVQLINKLAKENVNTIICGVDHQPTTLLYPVHGNHASAHVLKKQISWTEEQKGYMRQAIIKSKIYNQLQLLKKVEWSTKEVLEKMYDYHYSVEFNDHTNREGIAAKFYFSKLFGHDFTREDTNVVNAGLNYGYAVLRSHISSSLIAKGLNTSLGIFHRGPLNSFNLSDDIIEVFRPIVDEYVVQNLMSEDIFTREHRIDLVKLSHCKVMYQNKQHNLLFAIQLYIDHIIDCMEGNEFKQYEAPKAISQEE